ncbi:MAG: hypothetical protein Kow00107_06970 [Planctomycetota bacterium]
MQEFTTVDDILDFAIKNEQDSYDLYTRLAGEMKNPGTRKFFEDMAREELGHKARLMDVKKGKYLEPDTKKVMDLKIADYLVDVDPESEMNYSKALVFAMKAEKAEFKLYVDLADRTTNEDVAKTLMFLAQEEAKHKLKLEIEYDENVLREG